MSPELVVDYPCVLGEGPVWHSGESSLYWLDILAGCVLRYSRGRDGFSKVVNAGLIGAMTIQRDGSLLLFMSDGRVAAFSNGVLRAVPVCVPDQRGFRFNDCIVDPVGRVYSGTIRYRRDSWAMGARASRKLRRLLGFKHHKTGNLYRFDTDGHVTPVIHGIGRPNGMGLSPDRTELYVTDSLTRTIHAYEFDEKHGMIANPRLFVHVPASARATPDGLAVDSSGGVWSAHMNGGCVVRYRPDGTEERRIDLPTSQVTSLAFGGADYGDLYITTAGGDRRDLHGREAGALFRVRPGVSGLPDFRSHLPTRQGTGYRV